MEAFKQPTRNPSNHHKSPISPTVFIFSLIAISVAALIAGIWIIVMLRKLAKQNRNNDAENNRSVISNSGSSPIVVKLPESKNANHKGVQVFAYRELEAATGNFANGNVISKSHGAVVYRGIVGDDAPAVIKMLRKGRQGERAFRVEVDLLSRLQSIHLVQLFGYCADSHHRALVFEYMPNGTLEDKLHRGNDRSFDWGTRLRVALDCAMALEYLHEHSSPAVIHRDFNCRSVLLDRNFRAKISGLGLARLGSEKVHGQVATRVLGTTGYLAPEYASTGKLTTKSDVYSYGVVLLELLTGRKPVDSLRPAGEHVLVSWALPRLTNREMVEDMIDPVLIGGCLRKDLIQVAAVAAMCIQSEADYRPLMTDVVQSLIPLVKNPSSI